MLKRLAVVIVLFLVTLGCATEWKTRTVGSKDPSVEIAKENAATVRVLAEAMKAQADAIARIAATPSPTPTPTPSPSPSR